MSTLIGFIISRKKRTVNKKRRSIVLKIIVGGRCFGFALFAPFGFDIEEKMALEGRLVLSCDDVLKKRRKTSLFKKAKKTVSAKIGDA